MLLTAKLSALKSFKRSLDDVHPSDMSQGISLTTDQYNAIIEILPQVNEVLSGKGIAVSQPKFDQVATSKSNKADTGEDKKQESEDVEEEEEEPPAIQSAKSKLDKFRHKQNHEATSDEEEG